MLKQNLPHEEVIRKQAEATKQFLKKNKTWKVVKLPFPVLKLRVSRLSSFEAAAPKHHIKQGPVKSSKKLKVKTKDDDD